MAPTRTAAAATLSPPTPAIVRASEALGVTWRCDYLWSEPLSVGSTLVRPLGSVLLDRGLIGAVETTAD